MNENIGVRLVIYKKIVKGDLSKFTATSNITQNGGGARDLRFSPASEFYKEFKKMFPTELSNGVLQGLFSWEGHSSTVVQIHPPTNSRPTEVRIGKINECFPEDQIPDNADDCILLLILDTNGSVWPHFTSERSLKCDNWNKKLKKYIIDGLNAKRNNRVTAMGYIDFDTGGIYTNGQ